MKVDDETILYEYRIYINEIESPEEEVIIIYAQNPLERPSFLNEKEKSQRGDLNFDQIIDTDEMDEGCQNSNNPSSNEDLNKGPFSGDSLKDAKKQNNLNNLLNSNGASDDNERIDYITDILEESTISLTINYQKKNTVIKFGKIKYKNRGTTYEKLITPSKEKEKLQFEYNKSNKKYKELKRFLNKIEDNINEYSSKINLEKELLIQIKLKEDKNSHTINSEYIIDMEFLKNMKQYQDKNILKDDNYLEGFTSFLEEIINLKQESFNEISTKEETTIVQKYNFMRLIKVIGKRKGNATFIYELDDGSFLSNGIIQYKIKEFNQMKRNDFNKSDYFFLNNKKPVNISFKNESIALKKYNTNIPNIEELYPYRNLLKSKSRYNLIYNGTIYFASDFAFSQIFFILSEMAYIGGIKLTDDFIAFTSNRILSKGENKLVFFNSNSQKFLNKFEIDNYSFNVSENNCSIMENPKNENSKLLFVACKKYFEGDKNGILLIILQFNKKDIKEPYQKFYPTENFEVYCFCPILEIDLKNDKNQIFEDGYFLVGGFDRKKGEGLIKLYRVIYNDKIEQIKIEYILDIIIEKKKGKKHLEYFKGFKGAISYIIQSPKNGILAKCYDEIAYFSEPDLDKIREEIKIF